jgi:hypothetical protein
MGQSHDIFSKYATVRTRNSTPKIVIEGSFFFPPPHGRYGVCLEMPDSFLYLDLTYGVRTAMTSTLYGRYRTVGNASRVDLRDDFVEFRLHIVCPANAHRAETAPVLIKCQWFHQYNKTNKDYNFFLDFLTPTYSIIIILS